MRLAPFLVATAIGMTPATFLMAWAGDIGGRPLGPLVGGVLGVAVLAALAAWLTARWRARSTPVARPSPRADRGPDALSRPGSTAPGAGAGTGAIDGRAT